MGASEVGAQHVGAAPLAVPSDFVGSVAAVLDPDAHVREHSTAQRARPDQAARHVAATADATADVDSGEGGIDPAAVGRHAVARHDGGGAAGAAGVAQVVQPIDGAKHEHVATPCGGAERDPLGASVEWQLGRRCVGGRGANLEREWRRRHRLAALPQPDVQLVAPRLGHGVFGLVAALTTAVDRDQAAEREAGGGGSVLAPAAALGVDGEVERLRRHRSAGDVGELDAESRDFPRDGLR